MVRRSRFPLAVLVAGLLVGTTPATSAAQTFASSMTATCVGGAIGCSQVDFFVTLANPAATTTLDMLLLSLPTGSSWVFADPNLSDAADASGLTFVDPVVSGLGSTLTANFPFGAMLGGEFRIRAAFAQSMADLSMLSVEYVGMAGNTVVISGVLPAASVVPEPGSVLLLGTGLAGLGALGWRRRERSR